MTLAACAALVERGDPDRFAACMAAPPAARARLWPLYALNVEISRAAWASAEPLIAEMRLQWWRDAVADLGRGVVRGHEVMAQVAQVVRDGALPLDVLERMIDARRWDISRAPFANRAAFDAYLENTGAGLMWLAAKALGAPDAVEPMVRDAGWAMALAGYLRAVPELAARGRVPLVDGRAQAVADLARDGLVRLARARTVRRALGRRALGRAAAPALLAGWQTAGLLRLAVTEPQRVAEGRLQLSEFGRRGGLLWVAVTGRW
ncbi:MAG: squalene/phytoene synthase family protein [Pseudorhodobacter sp.]|nr:squalene/phytoene synthase family protein [Pseudorhodobacter sp.]